MKNFKQETLDFLARNGKSWNDVEFIQGHFFRVTDKNSFLELMDVEYDNGYGGTKIPMDLVIIGDGWWLERHDYDGSEWWEYKECPEPLDKVEDVHEFVPGKTTLHKCCNIEKEEYSDSYWEW